MIKNSDRNNIKTLKLIEESTIPLLTHNVFMHYEDEEAVLNTEDPSWKNQGVFFWEDGEKFERKSLPPSFNSFKHRYFIIESPPKNLSVSSGQVFPWFGMEGNGTKYYFLIDESETTLKEMEDKNIIQYIEKVELTSDNLAILNDRENYFLIINRHRVDFKNNSFYLNDQRISLSKAYLSGGVSIAKFIKKA